MFKAKDLMTREVVTVDPDDSVKKTIALMLKHRVSGVPVVDVSGRLLGIVSEFDLLDLIWDSESDTSQVYRYMSREVHTVDENDDLGRVAEQFRRHGIRRLPVMRGDRLVGIISRRDVLHPLCSVRRHAPAVAAS